MKKDDSLLTCCKIVCVYPPSSSFFFDSSNGGWLVNELAEPQTHIRQQLLVENFAVGPGRHRRVAESFTPANHGLTRPMRGGNSSWHNTQSRSFKRIAAEQNERREKMMLLRGIVLLARCEVSRLCVWRRLRQGAHPTRTYLLTFSGGLYMIGQALFFFFLFHSIFSPHWQDTQLLFVGYNWASVDLRPLPYAQPS